MPDIADVFQLGAHVGIDDCAYNVKRVQRVVLSMGVRLRAKHSLQRHNLVWPDWPKFLAGTWQQCRSGLHGAGSATRQGSSGIYYTVYIQQK
jgi:hypothetical protein